MRSAHVMAWIGSACLTATGMDTTSGQDYPVKPIRMVTSETGGASDILSRLIAPGLSDNLGQPVIVDDRPTNLAADIVAEALPDGYTLLLFGSALWTLPLIRKHMPYDAVTDFAPITLVAIAPTVLVVHPSVPVTSVKELIALAKAKPGELNYAGGAVGSPNHLAGELFKAMAGVNFVRIPFRGSGTAVIALVGGQVQLSFSPATAAMPHAKAGRLRALAVTSAQPSAVAPGLPTIAASGLPGYECVGMYGVFAPAKTPAALIDRLNQEIRRVLAKGDIKERFFNVGSDVVGNSPSEFAAIRKADIARVGKVVREAGIREQ
jgi:tripartite-type tricarboxylate transporter receptor subunit TctC